VSHRRTVRLFAASLALAAVGAAVSVAPGAARNSAATHMGFLRTPSKSIYCDYLYGGPKKFRYVRCGFNGKLVPAEKKPHGGCHDVDYVDNRLSVGQTGRGRTEPCAGDAGPFANPKAAHTVQYGKTWHGGPFKCTASKAGMTCRNPAGHGFFIAHKHWRVF
jgi:hypothetical protein